MFIAILTLGGLGLALGVGLAVAGQKFYVHLDPKQEEILKALPGANCGACGFAGCLGYAEALAKGLAEVNKCTVGGFKTTKAVGYILGLDVEERIAEVAAVFCRGKKCQARSKYVYEGVQDCRAAMVLSGGDKGCIYGCIGLGSCVKVCPFGAIEWQNGEPPVINSDKCVGCGLCFKTCPKRIIGLISRSHAVCVACKSHDKGKDVRAVCAVGCIGCGLCVKVCPEKAITLKDNLAIIDYGKCVGCGKCVEKCPTKTIIWAAKTPTSSGMLDEAGTKAGK